MIGDQGAGKYGAIYGTWQSRVKRGKISEGTPNKSKRVKIRAYLSGDK